METDRLYKGKYMIALVDVDEVSHIRYLANNTTQLAKQIKHSLKSLRAAISHKHEFFIVNNTKLKIEFIEEIQEGEE